MKAKQRILGIWALLFLAILVVLVVMGRLLVDRASEELSVWSTPQVAPSTSTPAATPGWWENMPTPDPSYTQPKPGDTP